MELRRRLYILTLLFALVLGGGISGFFVLGRIAGADPTILECAYQTVITLATVGNKTPELSHVWYGQLFIIVLIMTGMGVLLVFATTTTAFLVEGEMRQMFRRKRMDKILQKVECHYIVCGVGRTGGYVTDELLSSGHSVVMIDTNKERLKRVAARHPEQKVPYIVGHAADDDVLARAGLDRAVGVVVALPDDRDTLFVTVTAKQANPNLMVVVRGADAKDELRLKRAGADRVINPSLIGGMRMASEIARPQVVSFLDNMLRGQERTLRIEEIPLGEDNKMIGKELRDTGLRAEDLLVLAIRDKGGDHFLYNPPPETVLEKLTTLIVLGPMESVQKFRNGA